MNKIVCNSSPIIGLSMIGRLDLLWKLFDEVIIPAEVYKEVVGTCSVARAGDRELAQAVAEGKIKIYHVKNTALVDQLYGRLHHGELEVMVAAKELGLKHVIIDDRSARYFAHTMMIKTLGLIGLLLLAKQKNIIQEVKPYLDQLIERDYRVSVKLYNQILEKAEEL
ncbi:MAG: DUF3368 domain-containing protein [Cellulosilyticaceae bacterium]